MTTTKPDDRDETESEVHALVDIVKTLAVFPHDARSRILRSAAVFFGVTRADAAEPLAVAVVAASETT